MYMVVVYGLELLYMSYMPYVLRYLQNSKSNLKTPSEAENMLF